MEIVTLPIGQVAPQDSDCIRIQELAGGRFALEGSVLLSCGDGEAAESVSLIGGDAYDSYEQAEAAGIAWAHEHCPQILYVSRSHGTTPLPDVA
jgi:hypothetical protein